MIFCPSFAIFFLLYPPFYLKDVQRVEEKLFLDWYFGKIEFIHVDEPVIELFVFLRNSHFGYVDGEHNSIILFSELSCHFFRGRCGQEPIHFNKKLFSFLYYFFLNIVFVRFSQFLQVFFFHVFHTPPQDFFRQFPFVEPQIFLIKMLNRVIIFREGQGTNSKLFWCFDSSQHQI